MKIMNINATAYGATNHGAGNHTFSYAIAVDDSVSPDDVMPLLRDIAKDFCKTEDGKETYEDNFKEFNIGDLFQLVPASVFAAHNVIPMTSGHDTIEVDFDEQLVYEDDVYNDEEETDG